VRVLPEAGLSAVGNLDHHARGPAQQSTLQSHLRGSGGGSAAP
jgi:hypothetical protein